nr:MAG TPA: hypothetical protein [Caudoviricetes sp.]
MINKILIGFHGVHTLIPHQRYGNLKAFAFQI